MVHFKIEQCIKLKQILLFYDASRCDILRTFSEDNMTLCFATNCMLVLQEKYKEHGKTSCEPKHYLYWYYLREGFIQLANHGTSEIRTKLLRKVN